MTESSQETSTTGLARRWIPVLWIMLSITWAAVIFATDQPALPLALWIAITLGPISALQTNGNKERSTDGAADHAAGPIDVDTRPAEE